MSPTSSSAGVRLPRFPGDGSASPSSRSGSRSACALGVAGAARTTWWLLAFIAVGAALVPVYNLELLGGRLHTDLWFALAWGAFPVLTAYLACAERIRGEAVLAAAWAGALSLAQRRLSRQVRWARRQVREVVGEIELTDGQREPVTHATLTAAPETALQLLAASAVLAGAALVVL